MARPFKDVSDALKAADVRYLVQIGDHRQCACRHNGAGILSGIGHGTFQMGMAVDKTGRQEPPPQVNHPAGVTVIANAGDPVPVNGYVSLLNPAAKDVYYPGVA